MNFVNDSIIKAISWTLIHSLWLGLVLALLAGLTVLLTKKSTSAVRYNLLAALSVLFLVTIGFVFANEFEDERTISAVQSNTKSYFQDVKPYTTSIAMAPKPETPVSAISDFIANYGSWIVCIWFVIFSFKCFRMMGDLRHVYRVRNYQIVSPPEIWQQRLSELQSRLRIKRNVKLLESRLVNIPSVTGFFKPVILIPVGLLNNIPQDQVEAILLHELAHIRRSDYAVNLMQSFMEIMFFFNPGVLWISSLLKDERENCCDDLAISVTNDKKEFVNALVSFQEYNMSTQRFALQFGNQKMNLADRAKRILFNHNKMLSTAEKFFLSACMAIGAVLFLAIAYVNPTSAQGITKVHHAAIPNMFDDTLHTSRKYDPKSIADGTSIKYVDVIDGVDYYTYIFKHKGVFYQVPESLENFRVDGKLITGSERDKYLPAIYRLIEAYELSIADADLDDAEAPEYPDYPELESLDAPDYLDYDMTEEERIIDEASRKIDKQAEIIDKQSRIIEAEARKSAKKINWEKHNEAQRQIEAAQRKIQAESYKINEQSRKMEQKSRLQSAAFEAEAKRMEVEAKRMEAESRRFEAESRRMEAESRRVDAETHRVNKRTTSFVAPPEAPVCAPAQTEPQGDDITEKVIRELRNGGYNGNIRSFELNERNLIINGSTQSATMFEKVKKYTKPGMRIVYNIEIR